MGRFSCIRFLISVAEISINGAWCQVALKGIGFGGVSNPGLAYTCRGHLFANSSAFCQVWNLGRLSAPIINEN